MDRCFPEVKYLAGQYIKRQVKTRFKKIKEWLLQIPYNIRRAYNKKRIKSRDFTVISNNCWAGKLYQYLDMPYLSPTVGLYFFADDYLKFVKNLKYYMSVDLKFISASESKYSDELRNRNQLDRIIGVLDDVEIFFLHYHSEKEAYEKWNRRKARINWNKIVVKFSQMNDCYDKQLQQFDSLEISNKFMLTTNQKKKYNCEFYWNGETDKKGQILLDTIPFPGNLNISKILNYVGVR